MSLNMPIKHECTVKCGECEYEGLYSFNIEDMEVASYSERSQGTETQYDYTAHIICSGCGEEVEISGEVWEYPEGAINHIDTEK